MESFETVNLKPFFKFLFNGMIVTDMDDKLNAYFSIKKLGWFKIPVNVAVFFLCCEV